ncbi:MAG: phage tail sheath C-terminal domain-containing protein [Nostoc sp.]|uniref:phage tail sheath family protein n=1 Tax=Nostoc sp. TaxID=1180 RepID=UPI002FF71573
MPEYLAPGVYVEEVDTGPKPIEGVSTSTSGMVGVTEWGPENVATLVTGFADFKRQFGGYLNYRQYTDHKWYLPHTVEGFFTNGGKRLYIVRVLPEKAEFAKTLLFDRGNSTDAVRRLAVNAFKGHKLLLLESDASSISDKYLRLNDEELSEYVQAVDPPSSTSTAGVRTLRVPLYFSHNSKTKVEEVTATDSASPNNLSTTLKSESSPGESRINLESRENVKADSVLRIASTSSNTREFAIVASVPADPNDTSVTLRHPLAFEHSKTEEVKLVTFVLAGTPDELEQEAKAGSAILFLKNPDASWGGSSEKIIQIGENTEREYHVLARIKSNFPIAFNLKFKAVFNHLSTEPITLVTFPDVTTNGLDTTLKQPASAGDQTITLNSIVNLAKGQYVRIGDSTSETVEYCQIIEDPKDSKVKLNRPLSFNHPNPSPAVLVTRTPTSGKLSFLIQSLSAKQKHVMVADDAVFAENDIVEIGNQNSPTVEYKILGKPIDFKLIEIKDYTEESTPGGGDYPGLASDHNHGIEVFERSPLLRVQAIDRGIWGNSLQIEIEDDSPILDTIATADPDPSSLKLTLASIFGIEQGSILQLEVSQTLTDLPPKLTFPNDLKSQIRYDESQKLLFFQGVISELDQAQLLKLSDELAYQTAIQGLAQKSQTLYPQGRKVVSIDGNTVTLSAPHTVPISKGTKARTREFRLTIKYIQNNPLTGKPRTLGSEVHRHLSTDPRHSRYVTKVIGAIYRQEATTPRRADGRTEGESNLIRVEDALSDKNTGVLSISDRTTAENNIRIGPDLIWKILSDGRRLVVGLPLVNGDDKINDITDSTYLGADAVDPKDRQGLFVLKNIDEISIVAIPGRTSPQVQETLINHCELMRYRFAVMDSEIGSNLADVQVQRGLYDSKYAAIYYPWLRINDPFPDNPRITSYVSIPPSGHVIGIYARNDIERGVYKAPANEVIRGISDLEFKLFKEQQDILNPRNINVLRNFRENNRGLRVWGARTLSSDSDWKYINVRRLFIFIERSIDIGTQWVVFEPNNEQLWARVIRVISAFLTTVWRNGALMGLTPEQAFFVKCDRTTMTQDDIDNGRLIVEVRIAPVKPAEFVIFRIGQWVGGSSVDEG